MPYVKNSVNYKRRSKRSPAAKGLAIAAAVVLTALVFTIGLRPRTHAVAKPVIRRTPVQSVAAVRRLPAPAWGAAARDDVRAALSQALASGVDGARDWSCVVIAQDGSVLYSDRAKHAVEPASTQKLIVADAALTDLGARYRFDTLLAATRAPQDGSIAGDVFLEGSGDPSLRSSDLRAGVESLRKAGVAAIQGRVVVDGSAVLGEEINPLWNADDANEDFMTATSGISVDGDTIEFHVIGGAAGTPAQITTVPQSSTVEYSGTITSGTGDDVAIAATEVPNHFIVSGSIPAGVEEKFWVPVHGIAQYAGSVMDGLLKHGGISVAQAAQTGTVPIDAQILWDHRSKPLPFLLQHMLVFSDNHFAEQFMRVLGGENGGIANDAGGIETERHLLAAQAIPTPGLHLVDGSGLAHADRVAGMTLARILAHFDADPNGNELYPLLPRGGKDGTLKMYDFTTAAGRVRAKSGHLSDAASLAGYVQTRKHGRVAFAFLINGSPGDPDAAIVSAVDRLAER